MSISPESLPPGFQFQAQRPRARRLVPRQKDHYEPLGRAPSPATASKTTRYTAAATARRTATATSTSTAPPGKRCNRAAGKRWWRSKQKLRGVFVYDDLCSRMIKIGQHRNFGNEIKMPDGSEGKSEWLMEEFWIKKGNFWGSVAIGLRLSAGYIQVV